MFHVYCGPASFGEIMAHRSGTEKDGSVVGAVGVDSF